MRRNNTYIKISGRWWFQSDPSDVLFMGPNEKCLQDSLDTLGVEANAWFGGETDLVGNYWHKILTDFIEGRKTILDFLKDKSAELKKHEPLWDIISQMAIFFSTPNPSVKAELEKLTVMYSCWVP